MKHFGLIGFPLGHSFSKQYFTEKFQRESIEARYDLYPLTHIEAFNTLFQDKPLDGLNVTIPYKEQIIPFLHELDTTAAKIGAVNVVKFTIRKGETYLIGYNTDVIGFVESIRPYISLLQERIGGESSTKSPLKALVCGTGGAAKAIQYGLERLGIKVQFVSRQKRENYLTYEELTPDILATHPILVNATPLGTYPQINECVSINFDWITSQHLLFDVVYNPEETLFLQQGKKKGAITINGLEMLHLQAQAAWTIWNQ